MSGVDVLSVMDRARRTISAQSKLSDDVMAHLADDVIQARAAVAELIEAANRAAQMMRGNGLTGTYAYTALESAIKGAGGELWP